MSIGDHRIVTESIDFGECGEKDADFEVIFYAEEPNRGMRGPVGNAVQGCGSDLEIVAAKIGEHDVMWMFDAEGLALIADSIRRSINDERLAA